MRSAENTPEEISRCFAQLSENHLKLSKKLFDTPITDTGFTDEEAKVLEVLTSAVLERLQKSQGDPALFLEQLSQEGIGIIFNSAYLPLIGTPEQKLDALFGRTSQKGVSHTALFALPEQIEEHLQEYYNRKGYEKVIAELETAKKYKACIFLSQPYEAKSAFHEGVHAVQLLMGLLMDRKNPRHRIQRELETNRVMWVAFQQGLLKGVSIGKYEYQGPGPFGPTASLTAGDIFQETNYYQRNLKAWEDINNQE